MNKKVKNIIVAIIIVVVCFIILITFDCIRLKTASMNTKPIITISQKEDDKLIYYGLGYSVEYYKVKNSMGSGATFKLFNIIPIWSFEAQ